MTFGAGRKVDTLNAAASTNDLATENIRDNQNPYSQTGSGYEPTFLEAIQPALEDLDKYGIKVAVNAGNTDVKGLHDAVLELITQKGLNLKV